MGRNDRLARRLKSLAAIERDDETGITIKKLPSRQALGIEKQAMHVQGQAIPGGMQVLDERARFMTADPALAGNIRVFDDDPDYATDRHDFDDAWRIGWIDLADWT